jgi:hypothetical protein
MSDGFTKIGVVTVVLFVVSGVGVGAVGVDEVSDKNTQTGEDTQSFAVVQGESCYTIQPLGNGTKSVAAFYDYRSHGYGYSSNGTRQLQVEDASQLFFYRGNGGISLVILHDKIGGGSTTGGGTVTLVIDGLPVTGGWVVKDDGYPRANDSFAFNGSTAVVTWGWQGNRTDGGVYQAEPAAWDSRIRIVPHFNQESKMYPYPKWSGGTTNNQVERWIVRSDDGQAHALTLYQPVTIRPGTCKSLSQPSKAQNTQTNQNNSTEKQNATDSRPTTTVSTSPPQTPTLSGTVTDENRSIVSGPGFGIGIAVLALLIVFVVVFRGRYDR